MLSVFIYLTDNTSENFNTQKLACPKSSLIVIYFFLGYERSDHQNLSFPKSSCFLNFIYFNPELFHKLVAAALTEPGS